jgi:hypothetical protein
VDNIEEIKKLAVTVIPHSRRSNCWILEPPVELLHVPSGRIVHAIQVMGWFAENKQTVLLSEHPYWTTVKNFKKPPSR